MIVMKFGGTSVGDADRIRRACDLVLRRAARSPLVVVSAASGVTNRLVAAADAARDRREADLASHLAWVRDRHDVLAETLCLPASLAQQARHAVDAAHGTLLDLTRGVVLLGELSPRTRDAILALGELVSHQLVAATLQAKGARVVAVDPRAILATDATHGEAACDAAETARRCAEHVAPVLQSGAIAVTGGFVGRSPDGSVTTLGRGGGDLTATLLGVALSAEDVEIWTDVDGMMTADPRVVEAARSLPEVTFQEASELAYFGARVLHPATIRPAVEKRIPVRILNAFRPEHPGTLISAPSADAASGEPAVRAVAWKSGITAVSVHSPRMLGASGFLARVFASFERHRTPVDVVTTSEVSVSMTVDKPERVDAIERELSELCSVRVEHGLALICVVGRGFLESPVLSGALLAAVHPAPLRMVSLGSSNINLSMVVPASSVEDVVRRLHARFIEDTP